ncbi:MAG: helicase C-terminal domain-containing protein [Nanoarchaeota archaeon]
MAWSLHTKEGKLLPPLQFSTGKTQEDIVKEIIEAIKEGHKVIFLHGQCGTGKSAIALNLAKELGRASIVVPVKYLQKQYEEDYVKKLTVMRNDKPLSIAILTGRGNHPCLYNPASTAEDRLLPCSIDIKKENIDLLKIYIKNNEFVKEEDFKSIDDIKRLSVAPACPYWSPIIAKDWFAHYPLPDATKHEYQGLNNRTFTIFQRKPGCSYYQQFHSYRNEDVLIFNSKKYEVETMMDRKPATDIEIIDECDEFLDSLGNERKINLTILEYKIHILHEQCKDMQMKKILEEIQGMVSSIIKSRWLKEMMDNKDVLKVQDTKIYELMQIFAKNEQLLMYEELEPYFVTAKNFEGMFDTTYTAFSVNKKGNIICSIVNINLERKLNEFLNKNKVFVMMSGTLQTTKVLKEIFGIKNFKIIEAETQHQGKIIRSHTRLEKDFRYRNFESGKVTREEYLKALDASISIAELPALVHINSFADLPTEEEKAKFNLSIMSREKLEQQQEKYKKGELLQWFKEGKIKILYSTKCNRGVDLPGDMCKSIVFTKYPFPPMSSLFWRVFKESQPEHFMEFYFDKARREFLQRIYRGLRSKDDKVMLLSPDSQVLRSRI